jgi:hypothetical protein
MYVDSYENDPSRLYGSAQVKENKNPQELVLHRYSSLKYALCSTSVVEPDSMWFLDPDPDPDPGGQK